MSPGTLKSFFLQLLSKDLSIISFQGRQIHSAGVNFVTQKEKSPWKLQKKNVDTKRVVLFYTKWTVDKTRFKNLKNWLSFAWGCVDFTLSIMSRVKITQPYIKLSNVNIFYRTGHSGPEWNRFVQKTKKYKFVQICPNWQKLAKIRHFSYLHTPEHSNHTIKESYVIRKSYSKSWKTRKNQNFVQNAYSY